MSAPVDLPALGKASAAWGIAAVTRAVKTGAQTLAGSLTGLAAFDSLDWKVVLSATGIASLLSLLQSVGGLPELPHGSAPLQVATPPAAASAAPAQIAGDAPTDPAWPVDTSEADPYAVADDAGKHRS